MFLEELTLVLRPEGGSKKVTSTQQQDRDAWGMLRTETTQMKLFYQVHSCALKCGFTHP